MADNDRWWENAARASQLQLPASLLNIPRWILSDGETRRLTAGASMRQAAVGAGLTGAVLLQALDEKLPLALPQARKVMGAAMEGPLWLDISAKTVSIEGIIMGHEGGFARWSQNLADLVDQPFGTLNLAQIEQSTRQFLPDAQVGGVILEMAPQAGLSVVLQQSLLDIADAAPLFEALKGLAEAQGVGAAATSALADWNRRFLDDGARLLDVILPLNGQGMTLRWWNISTPVATAFVTEADCDAQAPMRLAALLKFAQVPDVARVVMDLKIAGNAPSGRLIVDMGLSGY